MVEKRVKQKHSICLTWSSDGARGNILKVWPYWKNREGGIKGIKKLQRERVTILFHKILNDYAYNDQHEEREANQVKDKVLLELTS